MRRVFALYGLMAVASAFVTFATPEGFHHEPGGTASNNNRKRSSNPLLKVPPASRGNRTGARLGSPREAGATLPTHGSPREAGGTSRREGIDDL
jgi:hypothetical protein